MAVLNIAYDEWKATAQAAGFATYHQALTTADSVIAFAGTPDTVLRALASDSNEPGDLNYTDWVANFQSGSTLVASSDDAAYRIIKAAAIAPTALGQMAVNVAAASEPTARGCAFDFWGNNQSFGSGSWTTVYDSATANSVRVSGCRFKVNSNKVYMRVLIDGVEGLNVNLDEFKKDFGGGGGSSATPLVHWLGEYRSKRWVFEPPFPMQGTSIKIEFKSEGGTKKVERGFTVRELDQ